MYNLRWLICNLIILCLSILPATTYALSGYSYEKTPTITGSSAAAVTGYTLPVKVSPHSNPIKAGSWNINGNTHNYRMPITVTEVTGTALTGYVCMIEINTEWLDANGYFEASAAGDEVEFALGTDTTGLHYYSVATEFGTQRHRYFVTMSLSASTAYTLYYYFDPDITVASSNSEVIGDILPTTTITEQVAQATDDFNNSVGLGCNYATNLGANAGNLDALGIARSGFRFQTVGLPNNQYKDRIFSLGACNLVLTARGSAGTTANTKVTGLDADDVATFGDCTEGTKTTAAVDYDAAAWTTDAEYSIAVGSIVEEIVGRAGWAQDNDMVFYWNDDGSASGSYRQAYGYYGDAAKAAKLNITAYLHPDYSDRPIVNVPRLTDIDVYLDGNSDHFPYDVQFTTTAGTQLYFVDVPESRRTAKNVGMTYLIKVPNEIPQSGTLDIKIAYGKSTQTTWDATYHSGSNAVDLYDDFTTLDNMTVVSGTWAAADQQVPIYKGGDHSWARALTPVYVDGEIAGLVPMPKQWDDFYGGTGVYPWMFPWFESGITAESDWQWVNSDWETELDQSWFFHNPDYNIPRLSYCLSIDTADGVTYWQARWSRRESDGEQIIGIYSTTTPLDNSSWVSYAGNPIWVQGQDGSPTTTTPMDGYLMYDSAQTQWVLYLAYLDTTNDVDYTVCDGTDPTGTYVYGGHSLNKATYFEGISVVPSGGTYTMFYSETDFGAAEPHQWIGHATCATSTGTFTDQGAITIDTYEWDGNSQGQPKFYYDGTDWNMLHFGIPHSNNGINDLNTENKIGWSKATTFPSEWAAQNVQKMAYQSNTAVAGSKIIVDGGNFGNHKISIPVMLKFGQESAGVMVRYQDTNNHYYVLMNRTANNVELYKRVSGTNTLIDSEVLPWTMEEAGATYFLDVACYGNGIYVSVSQYGDDFYELFSVTDTSLPATGNIGIMGYASTFYVGDLIIQDYVYPEPAIVPEVPAVSSDNGGILLFF